VECEIIFPPERKLSAAWERPCRSAGAWSKQDIHDQRIVVRTWGAPIDQMAQAWTSSVRPTVLSSRRALPPLDHAAMIREKVAIDGSVKAAALDGYDAEHHTRFPSHRTAVFATPRLKQETRGVGVRR